MRLTTRKDVLLDALVLALVSYASALSLAKMYAKKHNYTVRANQEFFALGLSNFGSSFFSCFPATASLSRASVMGTLARTQISSVISCTILLLVLLFLAPVLTTLPKCVVAVIIICAQKSLLMQCLEFTKAWKISRYEGVSTLQWPIGHLCFPGVFHLQFIHSICSGAKCSNSSKQQRTRLIIFSSLSPLSLYGSLLF